MVAKVSYYDILQVSPRASPAVINAAYRAIYKQRFPDGVEHGKSRLARDLNEAHQVLSDRSRRAEYDRESQELRGKTIGGEYRVLKHIADGGFGTTYLGEEILTGLPVCIKHCSEVSPEYERFILEEAKAVWDLRHFAIPAMRGIRKLDDGSLAIIMSYIPGPTLEQVVKKVGRLEAEHVAWITERVLNALRYLHFHGVVHGDVKPGNIILQPKEHMAVLVDYGLSAVKPTSKSFSKGFTPEFAPPEEIAGRALIPESDFYSLGITMLFALNGNMESVKRREMHPDAPDVLGQFIHRLIRQEPLARPNWQQEDLCETIQEVRLQAFGRKTSEMLAIPGF